MVILKVVRLIIKTSLYGAASDGKQTSGVGLPMLARPQSSLFFPLKTILNMHVMSLVTRTAQRWFDVTEAVLQIALLEQNLERLLRAQDLVGSRYARGVADILDVLQIDTNVATARSNISSQRQTVIERMRTLEVLIGSYPSGHVPHMTELPALGDLITLGIPTNLLEKRPDIMAAKNRVTGANYDLNVAKKGIVSFIKHFR